MNVARVVDYYQCSEAAFVLVAGTMEGFPDPWTCSSIRDRILEIFIYFAFSMKDRFFAATQDCVMFSYGVISNDDMELGLPDEIVGMYRRVVQVNELLFVQDTDSGR